MKGDARLQRQDPFRCIGIGSPGCGQFWRRLSCVILPYKARIDKVVDLVKPVWRQGIKAFGPAKAEVVSAQEQLFRQYRAAKQAYH